MTRKNKYNAIKQVVNGKTCDSKLEAKHYRIFLKCEKQGEITDLVFHPKWDAMVNGVKIGRVELDFQFFDKKFNKTRYIDSKGVYNAMSKWKHKHLSAQEGIEIEIWTK